MEYIYRHFCIAGVYVFTRCENRVRWILKEIQKLFGFSVVYTVCIPAFGTVVACINNQIVIEKEDIYLYIYYILIYSMWLFFCSLLVNILSVKYSGMKGYSIVAVTNCVLVALLSLWDNNRAFSLLETDIDLLQRNIKLLKLNPISHLFISWHSSNNVVLNGKINALDIEFGLNGSVLLMVFISVLVAIISVIYIKKVDLIIMVGREER